MLIAIGAVSSTVVKTTTQVTYVSPGALLPVTSVFLKMKTTVFDFVPRAARGRRPGSLADFRASPPLKPIIGGSQG